MVFMADLISASACQSAGTERGDVKRIPSPKHVTLFITMEMQKVRKSKVKI